jgi:hypothetical protein
MTYNRGVQWEIEYTDEFELWWEQLSEDDQERVQAAVEILELTGPALGRPLVDTLKGSQLPNMKELRPRGGHLRVLFAFDPRRVALLLLGGDKSGRWSEWYAEAIPAADERYDEHLAQLREEGELTD